MRAALARGLFQKWRYETVKALKARSTHVELDVRDNRIEEKE